MAKIRLQTRYTLLCYIIQFTADGLGCILHPFLHCAFSVVLLYHSSSRYSKFRHCIAIYMYNSFRSLPVFHYTHTFSKRESKKQPKSFFPKQIPVVLSFVLFLPYYFSAVFSISIFNSSTDIPALLAASSIDKIPSFTKPDKILTVASLLPSSIISSTA